MKTAAIHGEAEANTGPMNVAMVAISELDSSKP